MDNQEILSLLEKIKTVKNLPKNFSPEEIEKIIQNKVILNVYDELRRSVKEVYTSFLNLVSRRKDINTDKLNYIKKKYELIDKGFDINLLNISPHNYDEVFNISEDILTNMELMLYEMLENVSTR